jgi:hypothetical protein
MKEIAEKDIVAVLIKSIHLVTIRWYTVKKPLSFLQCSEGEMLHLRPRPFPQQDYDDDVTVHSVFSSSAC